MAIFVGIFLVVFTGFGICWGKKYCPDYDIMGVSEKGDGMRDTNGDVVT